VQPNHSHIQLLDGLYELLILQHFGLYQFKVLTFGLTNAPATFQSVMNNMLRPYVGKFVVVYVDDILIFSKTAKEHLSHLRQVLQTLRENQFYDNPKKCDFMKEEIFSLGHRVSANGLKVDPEKVRAVADWKVPKDVHGVRSFLRLANYFRRFLHGFKDGCPLNKLNQERQALGVD
jgi:hypothetical protein